MHADGPRGHSHLNTVDRLQPPVISIRTMRCATSAGSCSSALGCERGTRWPGRCTRGRRRPRSPRSSRLARRAGAAPTPAARAAEASGRTRPRSDHGRCLVLVVHGPVVECPVRLDIAHPRAGDPGEPIQRRDLVDHIIGQARRIDVDAAATEAGQVSVAHLGADRHIAADSCLADSAQDVRVAGMEAAGDIGAGDDVQQGVVIPRSRSRTPRRGRC